MFSQRNLKARLFEKPGMQRSRDLVGDERRQIIMEAVQAADPFNKSRDCITNSHIRSKGTPFTVSTAHLKRFIKSAREKFKLHYPNLG